MFALRNNSGAIARIWPLTFANVASDVIVVWGQSALRWRDVWDLSCWVMASIRRITLAFIHAAGGFPTLGFPSTLFRKQKRI
jgi:hypothetical protein